MQYAAESNTDFSERGQSPDYRFLRTRLESRIPIFDSTVVSLVLMQITAANQLFLLTADYTELSNRVTL